MTLRVRGILITDKIVQNHCIQGTRAIAQHSIRIIIVHNPHSNSSDTTNRTDQRGNEKRKTKKSKTDINFKTISNRSLFTFKIIIIIIIMMIMLIMITSNHWSIYRSFSHVTKLIMIISIIMIMMIIMIDRSSEVFHKWHDRTLTKRARRDWWIFDCFLLRIFFQLYFAWIGRISWSFLFFFDERKKESFYLEIISIKKLKSMFVCCVYVRVHVCLCILMSNCK